MTGAEVLVPDRLTGSLIVPALSQVGTSVSQLAYGPVLPRRGVFVVRKSRAEVVEMIVSWSRWRAWRPG